MPGIDDALQCDVETPGQDGGRDQPKDGCPGHELRTEIDAEDRLGEDFDHQDAGEQDDNRDPADGDDMAAELAGFASSEQP